MGEQGFGSSTDGQQQRKVQSGLHRWGSLRAWWAGVSLLGCLAAACSLLLTESAVAADDAVDVTLNLMGAAGRSSADDHELEGLQSGGHDPRRSGFTFQQAELVIGAQLDDWLRADAHLVHGEDHFDVEEAFLSARLHRDVELKAGLFYSGFGLSNPRHPHAWQWIDQNLAVNRMFGGENSRGLGLLASWDITAHERQAGRGKWRSTLSLGAQRADDETLVSFRGRGHSHAHGGGHGHEHDDDGHDEHDEDEHEDHEDEHGHGDDVEELEEHFGALSIGNRPYFAQAGSGNTLLSARWENAWQVAGDTRAQLGLSALHGPNASGPAGRTTLTGADFSLKWQPGTDWNDERWPFLLWESEYIQRRYKAAAVFDDSEPGEVFDIPGATLRDWAGYSQLVYGFTPGWAAGLRYERAGGSGESIGGRSADPLRGNRTRLSPLLTCWPEENLRLRLQYNHDRAQHLGAGGGYGSARSVWLGVDWTLGKGHRHSAAAEEFEAPGHGHDHDHDGHDHSHGDHGHDHGGSDHGEQGRSGHGHDDHEHHDHEDDHHEHHDHEHDHDHDGHDHHDHEHHRHEH